MDTCKSINCTNQAQTNNDFCESCEVGQKQLEFGDVAEMADKYPKYYKSVGNHEYLDVYTVHQLFQINDPSGCIQHASKKLLLSGTRTGGKSAFNDIKEARDTLTRWLQLNVNQ